MFGPIENHENLDTYEFLPSKRGFKLASLNINSLLAHIEELRVLLADLSIDVLAINETKLDSTVNDNEVYIPGYEIIRRDRYLKGRSGGGVCLYVRSTINYSIRSDLSTELETVTIEIRKPRSKPFVVSTWYRPPNSLVDIFRFFEAFIGELDSENMEYWVLGDLNCNINAHKPDNDTKSLLNIANVYGMHQLISEPTRITDKSSSLIDVIFTNCPERVVCSGVSHIGISDHSLVYAFRKISTDLSNKGHNTVYYRKFKNFDSVGFRYDIFHQNWSNIENSVDPNAMWDAWKAMFLQCVDKHAPLRVKRTRAFRSPWITPELKKRMHDRDILKLKASKSKDASDWLRFKQSRNQLNIDIRLAKETYYKDALHENEGDSRQTWRIVNELTSRKTANLNIKEIQNEGESIYNPQLLSETFNTHFATIGPKLANEIKPGTNASSHLQYVKGTQERFVLNNTNPSKVFLLLSKLCKSKATGLDKISARLLRESADLIANSLCSIFNRSINSGVFPDEWKCCKVIPLFKQGARSDLNNYRPISIIPVVAKVFERIIYDQIYDYLTKNGLLSDQQSGFRSLHSTVTALLEVTNDWAYNIDKGSVNAVVFLDLKKAFDTVDHHILLSKLYEYGVRGTSYHWFRSYLDNRKQKCFVNGSLSNSQSLTCGIPQGTILGPLLFLIYINDLPNCLSISKPRMYADDTHLTFASNCVDTINEVLNRDLAKVNEWLIANKLTLNASKTEFMLIGSRQRLCTFDKSPSLSIDDKSIKHVSSSKSLGVHIDENLSWNVHIETIAKKIASGLGALKRCRRFVPQSTLHSVFNALIQPHFDYCSVVWGHCNKTLFDKLQKLQNRAARILTFSSYDTNAGLLFERLGWKRLESQRQIQEAVMVYKSLNGLVPTYLQSIFTDRSNITQYELRDTVGKLAVPLPRTNYLKNSFGYQGAVLWNSLPPNLRQAQTLNGFRIGCRQHFS